MLKAQLYKISLKNTYYPEIVMSSSSLYFREYTSTAWKDHIEKIYCPELNSIFTTNSPPEVFVSFGGANYLYIKHL